MKVLITGGSGFLGINMIRYLLKKDADLVSLDLLDFHYPELDSIETVKGDIRNSSLLEKSMDGIEIVIHCAAALPLYSKDEIFSIDVKGTESVISAAFNANVKRFIQISTTAVYGIPDHHPLLEDDDLIGVGPYGEAKILAETICKAYRRKGMIVSIIRPKSFIGPERLGIFSILYQWADEGRNFPIIGKGSNRYQFLDVEDLCESIYLCMILDQDLVNDVFNIGAKKFTTMKEDYQEVLNRAGYNKRIIGIPQWPMITILRFLELLKLSPIYKWIYETAGRDSFVSIEKAEKVLGFTPKFSNKEALVRNFNWYRENADSFKNSIGITHRVPWKQGILKFLKIFF